MEDGITSNSDLEQEPTGLPLIMKRQDVRMREFRGRSNLGEEALGSDDRCEFTLDLVTALLGCVQAEYGVCVAHATTPLGREVQAIKMRLRSRNCEPGARSSSERRIPSYTSTHSLPRPLAASCVRRPETLFLRREDLNASVWGASLQRLQRTVAVHLHRFGALKPTT